VSYSIDIAKVNGGARYLELEENLRMFGDEGRNQGETRKQQSGNRAQNEVRAPEWRTENVTAVRKITRTY